jgi:hypothetical protein
MRIIGCDLHARQQTLAMNEGYRWKKKLFSEQGRAQLERLALVPGRFGAGKSCWSCWTP